MANLSRLHRYEKFVPDLGDNRELEQPFYLLVASSMSKQDYLDFIKRAAALTDEVKDVEGVDPIVASITRVIGDCIKLGEEPLTLDGKPIATMQEYVAAVADTIGTYNLLELIEAIKHFNSTEGTRALFYERLSGGSISTHNRRTAKDGGRRATH